MTGQPKSPITKDKDLSTTLAAEDHSVLDCPPNPARPPEVSEGDRELALIWVMAGISRAEAVADAAEAAARAAGLAVAMKELEDAGVTQDMARDAIRANGGCAAGALRETAPA